MAGTHTQGDDVRVSSGDSAAFWSAWDEFFTAVRRARGRAARQFGGLTTSQYHLLCAVEAAPEAGLRELAEIVGASAPTVTRMLTCLERDNVVERAASSRGARRVCVSLTARGQELLHAKRAQMNDARATVLASLTIEERAQLQRILPRLAHTLDAL